MHSRGGRLVGGQRWGQCLANDHKYQRVTPIFTGKSLHFLVQPWPMSAENIKTMRRDRLQSVWHQRQSRQELPPQRGSSSSSHLPHDVAVTSCSKTKVEDARIWALGCCLLQLRSLWHWLGTAHCVRVNCLAAATVWNEHSESDCSEAAARVTN